MLYKGAVEFDGMLFKNGKSCFHIVYHAVSYGHCDQHCRLQASQYLSGGVTVSGHVVGSPHL